MSKFKPGDHVLIISDTVEDSSHVGKKCVVKCKHPRFEDCYILYVPNESIMTIEEQPFISETWFYERELEKIEGSIWKTIEVLPDETS